MTIGKPFKPGQSGNPKGRPPMPPELKELRTRSREQVEKIVLQLYNKTEKEIEAIVKNPQSSNWERHVARMILKGIAKGDHIPFMALSDYIFGKRPERLDLTSSDGSMTPKVILYVPDNGFSVKEES